MWRFSEAPQVEPKLPVEELPLVTEKEAMPDAELLPDGTDLNRLAKAVAWAETHDCTKGYGASYNNCFGIKNGNTAPCAKIGRSNMCIYETPEQSYEAFKKIWSRWYRAYPNRNLASKWTGNDRPDSWLAAVKSKY